MKSIGLPKRLRRMGLAAAASVLMLGSGSMAFAAHGGGFHGARSGGGGFHGGHFGGFRAGGGFHGGHFGGFRGRGGFHGGHIGGFRGGAAFHGSASGRFRGGGGFRSAGPRGGAFGRFHGRPGYRGSYGYRSFRPYGSDWGTWWGLGLGLYLPVLPWYYTTFWWDDVPYYYVENDYYVWDADADEYEQVRPPPQVARQVQNGQVPQAPPQLYAYPTKGQTPQQQATDKRECSRWASAQTGLNPASAAAGPTQAAPADEQAGNPKPERNGAAASANASATPQQWQNYLRAEGACLEARGYSVD